MSGSNPGNLPQFPGTSDTRPASLDRSGMMRRWVVPTATIGGFVTTGTGSQQRLGVAPATASVAGSMSAADFAKLASLQVPVLRLNYAAAVDLMGGAALTAGVAANLTPALAFTTTATGVYLFLIRAAVMVTTAAALCEFFVRADIPGINTVRVSAGVATAGTYAIAGSGSFAFGPGAPAGAQTIQLQVVPAVAATGFCRPVSTGFFEYAEVQVWELAP